MPNNVEVKPYNGQVSVRSLRKNGKPYLVGTVMLKNVEIGHDGIKGEFLAEFTERRELSGTARDAMRRIVLTGKGFMYLDELTAYNIAYHRSCQAQQEFTDPEPKTLTGEWFRAAYVYGTEFYVDGKTTELVKAAHKAQVGV